MEKEDMQEKQVSEEEVSKQQDGQQDVDAPQLNEETTVSDNMGMHLINQQALQSQYIEKLEKLLLKDEITEQDIQNVEYCKAELLSQFLGATSFSTSLGDTDIRKKAADALSSHLGSLYAKTTKLKERLAQKGALSVIRNDVDEARFGASVDRYRTVTDDMLMLDLKKISLVTASVSAFIFEKTPLKNLIDNPKTRLSAMLPDLMDEFNQKTSSEEKESFSKWASMLTTGLSKLGSVKSIMNALQGNDVSKIMGKIMDSKDIA